MTASARTALFVLATALGAGACKRPCEEKGGPLTADERSWFVEPAGDTVHYMQEGTTTIMAQVPRVLTVNQVMGHFEREEHCEWGYEAGDQVVADGVQVKVEHYGVAVESNLNSARINGLHFSDHAPQDGVVVNGASYDGVYVLDGDSTADVHAIIFSKSAGLIAYTRAGARWLRVP